MNFEITSRDESGKPISVATWDGFAHVCRPYDEKTDGWMEDTLDTADFPLILAGRQMAQLVAEVNALRRENFQLQQQVKMWTKAAGFESE